MDPKAALIAAKLTGRMRVVVAVGRLDYVGRFQPFGQEEVEVEVSANADNIWTAKAERVRVAYDHPSPRIITHVGMFVYDRWLLDRLTAGSDVSMRLGESVVFDIEHPLPEEL